MLSRFGALAERGPWESWKITGRKSQVKPGVSLRSENPPMRAGKVRRSWTELRALRAILLNVLFKASERANPDGGGEVAADRPGRLILLIPFYAEIQRGKL
jgi:hypothetical protein